MYIQGIFDNFRKELEAAQRAEGIILTLGELLEKLQGSTYSKPVFFKRLDDDREFILDLDDPFFSYRGYYERMALGITNSIDTLIPTVGHVIQTLENALDEGTMEGYKGGDYSINKNVLMYAEWDYSSCNGMMINNVAEEDNRVLILLKIEQF